jgi:hypothetical protein
LFSAGFQQKAGRTVTCAVTALFIAAQPHDIYAHDE